MFAHVADAEYPVSSYTKWATYQPVDNMARECIKIERPVWKWMNADCEERNYFICLAGNHGNRWYIA